MWATATTGYDPLGRVTAVTEPLDLTPGAPNPNRTTQITYTPASRGLSRRTRAPCGMALVWELSSGGPSDDPSYNRRTESKV